MKNKGLQLKYFVLTPTKDDAYGEASRAALLAYAEKIRATNLDLSHDLCRWEIGCRHHITAAKVMATAYADDGTRID